MRAPDAAHGFQPVRNFRKRPSRLQSIMDFTPSGSHLSRAPEGEDDTVLLLRKLDALGTTSADFLSSNMALLGGVLQNSAGAISSVVYNSAIAFTSAVAPEMS